MDDGCRRGHEQTTFGAVIFKMAAFPAETLQGGDLDYKGPGRLGGSGGEMEEGQGHGPAFQLTRQ